MFRARSTLAWLRATRIVPEPARIGNPRVTVALLLPIHEVEQDANRGAGAGDPFEALGDPNRREILRLLSGGDKPVREIADAMTIRRPAVSRHLRVLKEGPGW